MEQQSRQTAEVSAKSGQVLTTGDNNTGVDNEWLTGTNIAVTQKVIYFIYILISIFIFVHILIMFNPYPDGTECDKPVQTMQSLYCWLANFIFLSCYPQN